MTMDETSGTSGSSVVNTLAGAGRDALAGVRSRAGDAASRTAEAARSEAMGRAETAKDSIAGEGQRLAQTLRSAAEEGDSSIQARLMAAAADSVDELAGRLQNRSFADLLSDAQAFARRNPGAFVAAAAVAGFALARFARASAQDSYESDYDPAIPATSQGYSTMPPASGDLYGAAGYGSGAAASAASGLGAAAYGGEAGYEGTGGMNAGSAGTASSGSLGTGNLSGDDASTLGVGGADAGLGTGGSGFGEGASTGSSYAGVSTSGMTTHDDETLGSTDPAAQGDDDDLDPLPSSSATSYSDRSSS